MRRSVPFYPKRPLGPTPWVEFGASPADYELWVPHICGPLGVAMAAAGFGKPAPASNFELVQIAVEMGVLVQATDSQINGAFHHPLLALARRLGIDGEVVGPVHLQDVVAWVSAGDMVLASVDLAKIGRGLQGSHLVLVHTAASEQLLLLHDCAGVLGAPGSDVQVDVADFDEIFNRKGLRLWRTGG